MALEIDWALAWNDHYEFDLVEEAKMIVVYNEHGPGHYDGIAAKIPLAFASEDQINACGHVFDRPQIEPKPVVPLFLEGGPFDQAVLPEQEDGAAITIYIGSKSWVYEPKAEQPGEYQVWEYKGEVSDSQLA